MTPEREKDIEDLINKRSQVHVRELWDAYQKQKERITELEAELALDNYSDGYRQGVEDTEPKLEELKNEFAKFLIRASDASRAKVEQMIYMSPEALLQLLKGK